MAAKLTVVVPTYRSIDHVQRVVRDFRNQLYQDFELILIHDGPYPEGWVQAVNECQAPNIFYTKIPKSKDKYPGTSGRNRGIELAQSEYILFCDDDDRYKDNYLSSLMEYNRGHIITIVQMRTPQSKVFKSGDPKRTIDIPESCLNVFPVVCHMGTPVATVKTEWAKMCPWRDCPNHDYEFFREIVELYKPRIVKRNLVCIDVGGCTIRDLPDWVTRAPYSPNKRGPKTC
jgi:glycosyltransferase involved in cell wall biosynthesis